MEINSRHWAEIDTWEILDHYGPILPFTGIDITWVAVVLKCLWLYYLTVATDQFKGAAAHGIFRYLGILFLAVRQLTALFAFILPYCSCKRLLLFEEIGIYRKSQQRILIISS